MSFVAYVNSCCRRLWRESDGAIIVETALVMPFLVTLMLGMLDLGLAMLVQHKVTKTANIVGNMLTAETAMTTGIVADRLTIVPSTMSPFNDNSRIRVLVTSLTGEGATVRTNWQIGSGTLAGQTSRFGVIGNTATVPNNNDIRTGDNALGIEVFYDHEWLFLPELITNDTMLETYVIFRTRYIPMTTI